MVVKYKLGKSYNRQGSEAEKLLRGIFKHKQDCVALQDALKVAEVLCGVEKKDAIRLYIEKLIEIDQHREGMIFFPQRNIYKNKTYIVDISSNVK